MRRSWFGLVGLATGTLLMVALLLRHDAAGVLALLAGNTIGILVVSLFHLLPVALDSIAWQRLCAPALGVARCMELVWLGQSVNALLPVAQVGGDLLRATLAVRFMPGATAAASVIIDLSLGALSQGLFTLLGVLLLLCTPISSLHEQLHWLGWAVLAVVMMTLIVLFAIAVQRGRLFSRLSALMFARFGGEQMRKLGEQAQALELALHTGWKDRQRVISAALLRSASCLAGSGEIWLGLWFLGQPVSLLEALLLDALVQAARSAAFFMPGGLGVQESGYLLIGGLLGIDAEIALALALMKRATHVLTGLPALLWLARRA